MRLEESVVNRQAAAFAELCRNGYIRIKDKAGVLLAELRFGDPAFNPSLDGVLTASDIKGEIAAPADGVADSYEVYSGDGLVKLLTGSVGLQGSGADMELPYLEIRVGMGIYISSFTHTVPRG